MKVSLELAFKPMMPSLQPHNITDLYVMVDDMLPDISKPLGGRPSALTSGELVTILIWNTLVVRQKTIKDIYRWTAMYHSSEFPKWPTYSAFVNHCSRVTPLLMWTLRQLLADKADIRFMDSTMVEVCKLVRADRHKVARSVAKFGKNHQGWHYGFKLHASVDTKGRFCGLALTPANIHDTRAMPTILNKHTKIAVGDGGYTARVMREIIWENYGTIIISPPHPKQNKKVMTQWQHLLLKMRPKIESVFGYIKEHMHFVTSFPRSVRGYLFHYLRILIGYQLMVS